MDGRYLWVLDGVTLKGAGSIDLLTFGNANSLVVARDGNRAYVGLGGSLTMANPGDPPAAGPQRKFAVIDLLSLKVLRTIDFDGMPPMPSPAGDRLYLNNPSAKTISVIRTADDAVIATIPMPGGAGVLALSPSGSTLYSTTTISGSNALVQIDTSTFAVEAFSTFDVECASGLLVSPDAARVYLSGACPGAGGGIRVFDVATRALIRTADIWAPQIAITPDGAKLVASAAFDFNGAHDPTRILDATTLTELGSVVPSGYYVAVDPSGTRAYSFGFWGNISPRTGYYRFVVMNLATYAVEKEGGGGTGLAATGLAAAPAPTPAPVALDKTSLTFAAVSTGAAFTSQTPAQTVRLRQSGPGTVSWTAMSTTPWLVVSPASGSGPATLSISTRFASGLTDSQTGSVIVSVTGRSDTVGPISVRLTTVSANAPVSPPFGVFDTPAGDSTVLAGSVAVTGWTLDNIGVQRVELWRDLQPGETTTPLSSTPTDPRNGKVFIASPAFVAGARPDVEGLYPSTPASYRGGWGYLMLTWGLWNQGNGTYKLYAFAFDQENNVAAIGAKTIVVNNNAATRPFGSIDTPGVGGDASGPNFGWALTPKVNGAATCKIQPNGVQVSIDSGPLQPVTYGDARTDVAAAFPGLSNSAAAGGHFLFDWSTLANGPHTIGWLITDDCNRADGVGSRFFNVTGGTSLVTGPAETSSDAQFRLKAETTQINPVVSAFRRNGAAGEASAFRRNDDVLVSRGYGELSEIVTPDETGDRTIEIKQGERMELRLPHGFDSAYQLDARGQRRALPIGATWDEASGIFYWQPAPAFLGRFRLVFSNGSERIGVGVVVRP